MGIVDSVKSCLGWDRVCIGIVKGCNPANRTVLSPGPIYGLEIVVPIILPLLIIRSLDLFPKCHSGVLNKLYFKTCNIRPYFLGHIDGLKIEGLLYCTPQEYCQLVYTRLV